MKYLQAATWQPYFFADYSGTENIKTEPMVVANYF